MFGWFKRESIDGLTLIEKARKGHSKDFALEFLATPILFLGQIDTEVVALAAETKEQFFADTKKAALELKGRKTVSPIVESVDGRERLSLFLSKGAQDAFFADYTKRQRRQTVVSSNSCLGRAAVPLISAIADTELLWDSGERYLLTVDDKVELVRLGGTV